MAPARRVSGSLECWLAVVMRISLDRVRQLVGYGHCKHATSGAVGLRDAPGLAWLKPYVASIQYAARIASRPNGSMP